MIFFEFMTFLTLLKCFSIATVQLNENILRIRSEKRAISNRTNCRNQYDT